MKLMWKSVSDLVNSRFSEVPKDDSGVYAVRWSKQEKPVEIQRLGGTDKAGILYIGSAKKLQRRIRALCNGINGKGGHTIGRTLTFCKLRGTILPDECQVAWKSMKTHDIALGQEWTAICDYSQKFKEPPPLNLELNRMKFALAGLAVVGRSRIVYEADDFVVSLFK